MKILYIHGFGSSGNGRTATLLRKGLNDKAELIAPSFPVNPSDAVAIAKKLIESENIPFVIASSYGGFFALNIKGIYRLVLNPCIYPSAELPKLSSVGSVDINILHDIIRMEQSLFESISNGDRLMTYGLFSTEDELFSHRQAYEKYYTNAYTVKDRHTLTDYNIETVFAPLALEIAAKIKA